MLPLGNIITKYRIRFHCYADDTQLYISTRPDETSKLSKLTECVKNIKYFFSIKVRQDRDMMAQRQETRYETRDGAEYGSRVASSVKTEAVFRMFYLFFVVLRVRCC